MQSKLKSIQSGNEKFGNLNRPTEGSDRYSCDNSNQKWKMCNLELPPYIINMPFINAIQRDWAEYVEGVIRRTPCMATALFYTVDENNTLCLFDGLLHSPSILLLTPLAYAILFNSLRVITFLLRDTPAGIPRISIHDTFCYTADCLDPNGIWFYSYRLLKFPPLLLRRPSAKLYAALIDASGSVNSVNFDQPQSLTCTIYQRNRLVTQNTTAVENAWEALWCIWRGFRIPKFMVDCSSELFIAGCDARKVAKRIDFEKLMTACEQTSSNNTYIVYFLQLLIFHGVDMQERSILTNYVNALLQVSKLKCCDGRAKRSLFISVFNLAGNQWKDFQKAFEKLCDSYQVAALPKDDQESLQMHCVRAIRRFIPGAGFFRHVWRMEELNESAKRVLMTGLIRHLNFGVGAKRTTIWINKRSPENSAMRQEDEFVYDEKEELESEKNCEEERDETDDLTPTLMMPTSDTVSILEEERDNVGDVYNEKEDEYNESDRGGENEEYNEEERYSGEEYELDVKEEYEEENKEEN